MGQWRRHRKNLASLILRQTAENQTKNKNHVLKHKKKRQKNFATPKTSPNFITRNKLALRGVNIKTNHPKTKPRYD